MCCCVAKVRYSKSPTHRNRLAGGSQSISKCAREIEPTVSQFLNVHGGNSASQGTGVSVRCQYCYWVDSNDCQLDFPCTFRNRLTASCEAISMTQTLTVEREVGLRPVFRALDPFFQLEKYDAIRKFQIETTTAFTTLITSSK